MNFTKRAGASRRSRRLALAVCITTVAGLAIFGCIRRGDAHNEHDAWSVDQQYKQNDVELATRVLQSVKGANAVMCAAVDRAFGTGSWGNSMLPVIDSISPNDAEAARWIGRGKLDAHVLDVVRPALADADPCTRRIAARMAGNTAVTRLDQQLDAELSAASPLTRRAAILALGFAEEKPAAEKLRTMLHDNDRSVRLAAAWALGSIEDAASENTMVQLLKSDSDPEMREVAAWALGQIADR